MVQEQKSGLGLKDITQNTETVIGNQTSGGIIVWNGQRRFLSHTGARPWPDRIGSHNGEFTLKHTAPITYDLAENSHHVAASLARRELHHLQQGSFSREMTVGTELEASLSTRDGKVLVTVSETMPPANPRVHPELLGHTLEVATVPNGKGEYPRTPIEIAHSLVEAVAQAYGVAASRDATISFASMTQSGRYEDADLTDIPYLRMAVPFNFKNTEAHWEDVPKETIDIYKLFVDDPKSALRLLQNWPVGAQHIHNKMPTHDDGLVDTRIAHAAGKIRLTQFAKVLSFLLYNTTHIYGVDVNVNDVRSIIRRLLVTSHDTTLPESAEDLVSYIVHSLEAGDSIAASRFPNGGHDRLRYRMDGLQTLESIDAPMNSDLRLMLGWIFTNQIMNVLGLEAMVAVGGDERKVIPYLMATYGPLFQIIPTLRGQNSSYQQDLIMNRDGIKPFATQLKQAAEVIKRIGKKYEGIEVQAKIVEAQILNTLEPAVAGATLSDRMKVGGIQNGILTDYKREMDPADIVLTEHDATLAQAQALAGVRDDHDLRVFMGVK